jgi:hypothetical protein
MQIQASLERDIDFSDVAEHNSHCPRRGLYYRSAVASSVQDNILRWT